jgi:hypothetical protein
MVDDEWSYSMLIDGATNVYSGRGPKSCDSP